MITMITKGLSAVVLLFVFTSTRVSLGFVVCSLKLSCGFFCPTNLEFMNIHSGIGVPGHTASQHNHTSDNRWHWEGAIFPWCQRGSEGSPLDTAHGQVRPILELL